MDKKAELTYVNSWLDTVGFPYLSYCRDLAGQQFGNIANYELVESKRNEYWWRVPDVYRAYISWDAVSVITMRDMNFGQWLYEWNGDTEMNVSGLVALARSYSGKTTLTDSEMQSIHDCESDWGQGNDVVNFRRLIIITNFIMAKLVLLEVSDDVAEEAGIPEGSLWGKLTSWYADLILGEKDANGNRPEAAGIKKFLMKVGVAGAGVIILLIFLKMRKK